MATKYGYVSRDRAERQIDWGEIGKQVSDEIVKINEDRKERREDILQKSTDYAKMLVEMPMGSNTAFNEYLAQFTSQASKAALEDLNALKRGEISEQEYYNRRANLKSGTELMIAGANNFNKNYDLIQERIDKGVASLVEIKYREKMAELLEFGNRTPFINPDTREVNTARLAPSGVMETTVEDIASASDMFRISNFQLNKFNMDEAVNDIKKGIGIQEVTVTQEMVDQNLTTAAVGTRIKGAFNSVLMSEDDSQKAKQDLVSSYMKDDAAVISILADYVPGFGVTLDPFEVDKNTVLIARDGSYEISDAQRKAAEDYMIKKVDQALPEEVKPPTPMTENQRAQINLEQQRINIARENLELNKRIANIQEGVDSYTASDNLMVNPNEPLKGDGNPNLVNPRNYLSQLNKQSFSGAEIGKTVNGIQAVLNHQGFNDAEVSEVIIEPMTQGGTRVGNFVRQSLALKAGQIPPMKIKGAEYAIQVSIPNVLTEPIVLPVKSRPGSEIDKVIELIDFAKNNNKQITPENISNILNPLNKRLFDQYQNTPVTGGTSLLSNYNKPPENKDE
jgi:hypothetical protein